MSKSQTSKSASPISPYTLLAVTALSISNLMVGILQANSFLMLASAGLAAAFAWVYALKSGMLNFGKSDSNAQSTAKLAELSSITKAKSKRFPLWLFIAVIFVMMPAALLFLEQFDVFP